MKYEVGDKVRIREDLTAFKTYNGTSVVVGMLKYSGKIATITDCFPDGSYVLDIDSDNWSWTSEMFDQNWKEDKYMKTSEFKDELEKLGYTFEDSRIKNEQNLTVAWISTSDVNTIDSNYDCKVSPKLFNLITKYAATPIAEREDEKLFNVQIIKGNWGSASWLYRDVDDDVRTSFSEDNDYSNQQWTLEQIKEYEIDDESVYKRVPVED